MKAATALRPGPILLMVTSLAACADRGREPGRLEAKTAPLVVEQGLRSITAGIAHTCAITTNDTVHCWGQNLESELGNGHSANSSVPVGVVGLTSVSSLVAGDFHTCAIRTDDSLWCWGSNTFGQLGNGVLDGRPEPIPVPVAGLSGVASAALGDAHTCALLNDGTVSCWGNGGAGSESMLPLSPTPVAGLAGVVAIAAGQQRTCAALGDGTVRCWGSQELPAPVAVPGLTGVVALSAGRAENCALSTDGVVRCWRGVAGTPVVVAGLSNVSSLTSGAEHSCARLSDGTVRCWGRNFQGQLGNGTTNESAAPVAVTGLAGVTSLDAGGVHTCAVLVNGTPRCWGSNELGQLGSGGFAMSTAPNPVTGITAATALAAGSGGGHTCALLTDRTVRCWGGNTLQELGDGTTDGSFPPVSVPGLSNVSSLAAGWRHTCALLEGGSARCWGWGDAGQLGNGQPVFSSPPVAVSGLSGATSLAAGGQASCAVLADRGVSCWGGSQLFIISGGISGSSTPVAVPGLTDVLSLALGNNHACALLADGTVRCWGFGDNGELGHGEREGSPTPVAVTGVAGAVALTAGEGHTCALLGDGTARCWGWGNLGQLGNGSQASLPTPVAVSGLTDAKALAAGADHTCAAHLDGRVSCWGWGASGQLGHSGHEISPTPIAVPGLTGVVSLAAGSAHTCASLLDGSVRCWGGNDAGQIGLPPLTFSATPVEVLAGQVCTSATDCGSGFCVDGVCCDSACGGSNPDDCLECTLIPGAELATCGALSGLHICRGPAGACDAPEVCTGISSICPADALAPVGTVCRGGEVCDLAETCTGDSPDCPPDVFASSGTSCGTGPCDARICAGQSGECVGSGVAPAGTACGDDGNPCTLDMCDGASVACQHPSGNSGVECAASASLCENAGQCSGGPICPGTTPIPGCVAAPAPGCAGPCDVDLRGGKGTDDGITVTFQNGITSPGEVSVTTCNVGSSPATGFKIVVGASGQYCFDINTGNGFAIPRDSSIIVCIQYPAAIEANEANFQMMHDDGSGFMMNTADRCLSSNCQDTSTPCQSPCTDGLEPRTICGFATSLSPFAIVEPVDTAGPAFVDLPGTIVAYATSTAGAIVSYAPPTAVDAIDGPRPVSCLPGSGSQFPPGQTTVNCTTADASGNPNNASFVIWVQYQAPADGSFFLKPIRVDGSSVFKIGRPVPVKFRLTGPSQHITDLQADLVVNKISDEVRGTADDESDEDGDETDFLFKYRKAKNIYGYRWKTRDQTRGTYRLGAQLGDGVVHEINVSLRKGK